jgi:hypothetical protein
MRFREQSPLETGPDWREYGNYGLNGTYRGTYSWAFSGVRSWSCPCARRKTAAE